MALPAEGFPKTILLRHFIVLPALAMGAAIALSRIIESWLLDRLDARGLELFSLSRTIVISLLMASLIGWMAANYRRQYERELEARNKRLEEMQDFLGGIVRDSAEGIVTLDIDDRVTSWNPAAERIFGWRADEVVGTPVARLVPQNARIVEDRRQIVARIRMGETVRDHETTRINKNGKEIPVRVSWSPLHDAAGRDVGTTGIVLDVSAEREMRERLVERERLAAVGKMAAHVAHEIRNPLAGIRGACEILFAKSDKPTSEIGGEVLHQIDRLSQTVNELLQFSNPRSIETAATDLNGLIDRVVTVFQEDPAVRSVRLEHRQGTGLPVVQVDQRQIEQVLYNLLLNAAQAMDYEGSIVITTEHIDDRVEIRVRDSGPGISPEIIGRVFDPFFTTRTEGTGLGLSIVQKIVEAHGGKVDGANRPEGGAEFLLRFPVHAG